MSHLVHGDSVIPPGYRDMGWFWYTVRAGPGRLHRNATHGLCPAFCAPHSAPRILRSAFCAPLRALPAELSAV
eukprot:957269-Prymnesium_polylepis.2